MVTPAKPRGAKDMKYSDPEFDNDVERASHNDPTLTSVVFDFRNTVGRTRLRILADALRGNTNVTRIVIKAKESRDYRMRCDHVSALAQLFRSDRCMAIKVLRLKMDFETPNAAFEFGKLFCDKKCGIEGLHVSASFRMDAKSSILESLAQGLSFTSDTDNTEYQQGSLTRIKLSRFDLDRESIDMLCSYIIHNKEASIKYVDLRRNTILMKADLFGEAMFGPNSCLETIALGKRESFFEDIGDSSFFSMLEYNSVLDTLLLIDLGHFPVARAAELASVLCRNTTIQELHIECNDMDEDALLALAPIFRHNTSLERFSLQGNHIGDLETIGFASALCDNSAGTHLIHLALDDNEIGDSGAEALSAVLLECKTIKTLCLSHNEIGDYGATCIAEAIAKSDTIEELSIDNNSISANGHKVLVQSLYRNISLKQVNLGLEVVDEDDLIVSKMKEEVDECIRLNKIANEMMKHPRDVESSSPALFREKLSELAQNKNHISKVFAVMRERVEIVIHHS
eukprot:CAMPEP_0198290400 /NCGR_PEP_ID=MMETSP1449-20131203/8290_1 /TAXON_ID=420275 /ORGANISM="Attheya septentrionalis, Strain CCMP2084" /LENGTH=512 /DNA_ID=CAMNT_0043988905 /DNA_START=49 /DNA_END=1587 /DNA_ORIENTATION=+